MSRILVLIGSSRHGGNTEMLARSFAEGARTRHEVELLSVADLQVSPCRGCNACSTSEGHACAQRDDMDQVYEKLHWADTLILASPVYFYGLSAQLKAVIDRLHTPMRNGFSVRRLGLILAGAAVLPDLFDPILLQYRMALRFFKLSDAGRVLVSGVREKGDVRNGDGLTRAYEMGCNLREE